VQTHAPEHRIKPDKIEMKKPKLVAALLAVIALAGIFVVFEDTPAGLRPVDEGVAADSAEPPSVTAHGGEDPLLLPTDSLSTRWFYSRKSTALLGIALVIHGLNLHPDRMGPIINRLTRSGIDVLRLSLRGHGDNFAHRDDVDRDSARLESFKNVSYALWTNEAYLAYRQVRKRSQQQNAPVFLAAFSIGGLIGLDLFASHADVHFDRIVLWAPAIALRPTIYLERVLSPFPRLVIPSMADDAYLANKKGTPVAAYNALFDTLYHFEDSAGPKLNVPTLVFIGEKDEFIPLQGLKLLVSEHHLDQWKFHLIEKDEDTPSGTFHHHIIDAASAGKQTWKKMMTAAIAHLSAENKE